MIRPLPAVLGLFVAATLASAPAALAQLPPLGGQTATPPPAQPAGIPPLAGTTSPPTGLSTEAMNADLKNARAANLDKRYADAETLMLKDTAAKPNQPYLWIELGLAQLGEKKYPDAEASFKSAIPGGGPAQAKTPDGSFYTADGRTAGHVAIATVAATADPKSKGEIEGISNASLGEIYIHTNRIPDAQAAFDKAAAANPSQAGLYYGNETVFLFQAGTPPRNSQRPTRPLPPMPRARATLLQGPGPHHPGNGDPKTSKLDFAARAALRLTRNT